MASMAHSAMSEPPAFEPFHFEVGFIGAGQMASALINGFVSAGLMNANQIHASDAYAPSLRKLEALGVHTSADNKVVTMIARVLWLAVKPDVLPSVLEEIAPHVTEEHLLVSIAAGVTLDTIEGLLPPKSRVIRVMPNTPCLVQASASAYCLGKNVLEQDVEIVHRFLSSVGAAELLSESKLNAVTGLSGSGPAYVFVFIEALADGGVRMGLPRKVAIKLAAQTVLGAAKMVLETQLHPALLKDNVASPGGTTIAGLHALEAGAFRGTVKNAVKAATDQAVHLSTPLASKL